MNFDVFNGDADGICSLIQLRLAEPRQTELVTGVKRDIELLQRVNAHTDDLITVLDISFAKNVAAVNTLLDAGAHIFYIDHHQTGAVPEHPHLTTFLDTSADVCSSLLVDRYLQGQFRAWAVVGAFGDNLLTSAKTLAKNLQLTTEQLQRFEELGTYINYNAYGSNISDLHIAPDQLFRQLVQYPSPVQFIEDCRALFEQLQTAYHADLAQACRIQPEFVSDNVHITRLPDQPWARRVCGVYSNQLANQNPQRAHAMLTPIAGDAYLVNVRAALTNKRGADVVCSKFATGGGRAAAAGINRLPKEQLADFIVTLENFFGDVN